MYVKIFEQIYDSSIADNYLVRFVFEDFLILADKDGCVDMTAAAIARRTNVPLKVVNMAIEKLSSPDLESRSPNEDGRRIVLLDQYRSWGWRIINYAQYRNIRDNEARKEYFRDRKREQRSKAKGVLDSQGQSTNVTKAEALSNKHSSSPAKPSTEKHSSLEIKAAEEQPNAFMAVWNENRRDLPKVIELSDDRRNKIQTRIRGGLTIERFAEAVKLCATTPFLTGSNDRKWRASFDWLLQNDSNALKVLEGKYGSNAPQPTPIEADSTPLPPRRDRVISLDTIRAQAAIQ
jgi:hypothetical protein